MDGISLEPLTNDEHAKLVSQMRDKFPDFAKPRAEKLLEVEKLKGRTLLSGMIRPMRASETLWDEVTPQQITTTIIRTNTDCVP